MRPYAVKRRRLGTSTVPAKRLPAERRNQVWALDLIFDSTVDGRPIKALRMCDEHTRESIGRRLARSITADDVVEVWTRPRLSGARPRSTSLCDGARPTIVPAGSLPGLHRGIVARAPSARNLTEGGSVFGVRLCAFLSRGAILGPALNSAKVLQNPINPEILMKSAKRWLETVLQQVRSGQVLDAKDTSADCEDVTEVGGRDLPANAP